MQVFFKILLIGILFFPLVLTAQKDIDSLYPGVDSLYREDQFYLGFTYNILTGLPEKVAQSGFAGGVHLGFIRDFPINKERNIAIGAGLGWSFNTYGQNLLIAEVSTAEETIFRVLDNDVSAYKSNRFSTQSIDVPLQFRWRSSTASTYKFWRIYTGLKLGYAYYFRSTLVRDGNKFRQTDIPEFNPFRLGATFTFGYNTFNFHFYYSLLPFFNEEAQLNGQHIEMSTFQIGLMFYIL